jgi:hypothetical protein
MRLGHLVIAALFVAPLGAQAEEPRAVSDIAACVQRNLPTPGSIRAVRIVARDRLGAKQVTVAKFYSRQTDDGLRQLLVRLLEPEDVRGTALLMLQRDGENEIYLSSNEFAEVRQIKGVARAVALFGSDFSYEDFQYLQGFTRPSESKRLEDTVLGDRPVYVLETRPLDTANSAYRSIVAFVDKETCVALRMEFYEPASGLRKVLTVDNAQIFKRGSVWMAHIAMLRDIRDYTTTQVFIDSREQATLPAEMFTVEALQQGEGPGTAGPGGEPRRGAP